MEAPARAKASWVTGQTEHLSLTQSTARRLQCRAFFRPASQGWLSTHFSLIFNALLSGFQV